LNLNKLKNEFLGVVAHDLRGPLGTITGNIEFLLDITKPSKNLDVLNTLQDVLTAADHMLSVINGFLDVSTLNSGSITLNKNACNLARLLENSIAAQTLQANHKGISVDLDASPEVPILILDEHRVRQVIDNYLSNALKYSYRNTCVYITTRLDRDNVVCSIRDEGQGIEEHFLNDLFQPFKQTSATPTDGESSTGLGLYIVKSIIEKHGGKVWAESEINKGSSFFFSLPMTLTIQADS